MALATTISVSGVHGWLVLIAVIAFLVSAVVAWFVSPRAYWATGVAGGLCLWALAALIH